MRVGQHKVPSFPRLLEARAELVLVHPANVIAVDVAHNLETQAKSTVDVCAWPLNWGWGGLLLHDGAVRRARQYSRTHRPTN